MKIQTFKVLIAVFCGSALSVLSVSAQPAPSPSDTFSVFATRNNQTVLFASASASEAEEGSIHIVLGPTGAPLLGNPQAFGLATALIDGNGNISDIFGVFQEPDGVQTSAAVVPSFLAFISDPDPGQLNLTDDSYPGFGHIEFPLSETLDFFDATRYLGTVGVLEAVTYSATFSSDREVPDSGTACALLGLGLTGLAFLRRKLTSN